MLFDKSAVAHAHAKKTPVHNYNDSNNNDDNDDDDNDIIIIIVSKR